ncbi:MAG TPA: TrbI/VirB10 family protein [Rhodopila sp.]|nr:TrbI/VirB10 family protein [Rhodopila sp.]
MTPPPPPQGLPMPPRRIVRLRRGVMWVGLGAVSAVAIVVYLGLTSMGQSQKAASSSATPDSGTATSAIDVLKNAPTTAEIEARRHPVKRTAFSMPAASAPAPAPSQPPTFGPVAQAPTPDDMTDAAIAGRRAAWQQYYQQLAQMQQQKAEARHAAMVADTEVMPQEGGAGGATAPANGVAGGGSKPQQAGNQYALGPSSPATDYSQFTETDPISPYELKATDTITARLVSAINSDSPGIAKAVVTKNVMDHATGLHILIPQGSTLVGYYDTAVSYGQTRLVTAWTRIIYPAPCDQSLDLGSMPGSDQTGQAGFSDLTDNHLGKVFTSAILMSLFGAGIQLSQPPGSAFQTYNPVQTAGGAIGQQLGQLGQQFAQKGLSIPPTERIRQGYDFAIMVTKDIAWDHDWHEGVCAESTVTPE